MCIHIRTTIQEQLHALDTAVARRPVQRRESVIIQCIDIQACIQQDRHQGQPILRQQVRRGGVQQRLVTLSSRQLSMGLVEQYPQLNRIASLEGVSKFGQCVCA